LSEVHHSDQNEYQQP